MANEKTPENKTARNQSTDAQEAAKTAEEQAAELEKERKGALKTYLDTGVPPQGWTYSRQFPEKIRHVSEQ